MCVPGLWKGFSCGSYLQRARWTYHLLLTHSYSPEQTARAVSLPCAIDPDYTERSIRDDADAWARRVEYDARQWNEALKRRIQR